MSCKCNRKVGEGKTWLLFPLQLWNTQDWTWSSRCPQARPRFRLQAQCQAAQVQNGPQEQEALSPPIIYRLLVGEFVVGIYPPANQTTSRSQCATET